LKKAEKEKSEENRKSRRKPQLILKNKGWDDIFCIE
jgi:hypothetical protein